MRVWSAAIDSYGEKRRRVEVPLCSTLCELRQGLPNGFRVRSSELLPADRSIGAGPRSDPIGRLVPHTMGVPAGLDHHDLRAPEIGLGR